MTQKAQKPLTDIKTNVIIKGEQGSTTSTNTIPSAPVVTNSQPVVEKRQVIAVLETNKLFDKAVAVLAANNGNGKVTLIYSDGRLILVNAELTFR